MARKGEPAPKPKVTAANTPAKKKHVVGLIAEGRTFGDACTVAEVSRRTFQNWRQRDERFALEVERAMEERRDALVDWHWRVMHDETGYWPPKERWNSACFLTKQADPSFRDNHKVEHVASGDLRNLLKEFVKAGRE